MTLSNTYNNLLLKNIKVDAAIQTNFKNEYNHEIHDILINQLNGEYNLRRKLPTKIIINIFINLINNKEIIHVDKSIILKLIN